MTNNVSTVSFQSMHKIISGRNICANEESQQFLLKFYKDKMKFTEKQIQAITHRQSTLNQLEPNEVKTLRNSVQKGIKKGEVALLKKSNGDTFLLDQEDVFVGKALRARSQEKALKLLEIWENLKMKKPPSGRDSRQQAESAMYFGNSVQRIKRALELKDKNLVLDLLAPTMEHRTNMSSGDYYTSRFDRVSLNICNKISEKTGKYVPYYYVASK